MPPKKLPIPINAMANEFGKGISVERLSLSELPANQKPELVAADDGSMAHRHDGHSFFLLESGSVSVEIDFQKHVVEAPSVIYVHPNQVHRTIASEDMVVSSWAVTEENINPDYLALLEDISPAKALTLDDETFATFHSAVALCLNFAQRTQDIMQHALLKDSVNALIVLTISQYLTVKPSVEKLSRSDTVYKAFRKVLEQHYTTIKSPAAYADKLNVSAAYLNECVKNATGHPLSYHIQQRVVLEAKRLLFHSDKNVKEIAAHLGYDDYQYFSRLFTKIAGVTALAFRRKNLN